MAKGASRKGRDRKGGHRTRTEKPARDRVTEPQTDQPAAGGDPGGEAGGGSVAEVKSLLVAQAASVEMVPKHRITPHPQNPRRGDVGSIEESIVTNGFYGACLVQRSTGYILVGSHRFQAAVRQGAAEIPVIYLDVDDTAALRILLADNRTNDLASYERATLLALLDDLAETTGSLVGTGYNDDSVKAIARSLQDVGTGGDLDDGGGEQGQSRTGAKIGPYAMKLGRDEYLAWLEDVRQEVGFDDDSINAEIARRLGI